jgi:hypothetical protein
MKVSGRGMAQPSLLQAHRFKVRNSIQFNNHVGLSHVLNGHRMHINTRKVCLKRIAHVSATVRIRFVLAHDLFGIFARAESWRIFLHRASEPYARAWSQRQHAAENTHGGTE